MSIEAFYMAPANLRVPRTGEAIVVGGTVGCFGEPVLCENGLHASIHVLDALKYRSAGCLTLVEIGGDIREGEDKLCGTKRTTIATLTVDQTERVLREIACQIAGFALQWGYYDVGAEPDQRSIDAIDTARRFARGECSRSDLDAAWDAAWAAAWAAAGAAARAAAWAAADRMARDALLASARAKRGRR